MQATGSFAGTLVPDQTETSLVQFIDSDIFPEFQNMKLVQSGLYSTSHQREQEDLNNINIGGAALGFLTDGYAELSSNALNNYAVGVLHDEVRQMYRGDVWMTGNGWVRPRHLVHYVDSMQLIAGPVEVREVEHSFSSAGGFLTRWTPDAVALAHDTQKAALSQ